MNLVDHTIGEPTSDKVLIYFHGLDEPTPSPQEQENRKILTQISNRLSYHVIVLRSKWYRDSGQLHWPYQTVEERSVILSQLVTINRES